MWAFFAFFIAVEMSDGLLYTLIGFIALCVPVWGFYGIRWVLALQRFPVWTLALFLLPMMLASAPFLFDPDYRYDDAYGTFYLLAAPAAFFSFRFLHNRQYATASLKDNIAATVRRHRKKIKGAFLFLALILGMIFISNGIYNFMNEGRPSGYNGTVATDMGSYTKYDMVKQSTVDSIIDDYPAFAKWLDNPDAMDTENEEELSRLRNNKAAQ